MKVTKLTKTISLDAGLDPIKRLLGFVQPETVRIEVKSESNGKCQVTAVVFGLREGSTAMAVFSNSLTGPHEKPLADAPVWLRDLAARITAQFYEESA